MKNNIKNKKQFLKDFWIDLRIIFKLYNQKEINQKQRLISGIQNFFEHNSNQYNIHSLGISQINFKFKKESKNNICEITITLANPGLLIGKGGRTINALTSYLTDDNYFAKIKVKESNVFKTDYKHIINL
jgi:ribosomal protein S3